MQIRIEAVFENGVLKPTEAIDLPEKQRVRLTLERVGNDDWLDAELMADCRNEVHAEVSLDCVRSALSGIRGQMADAVLEERGTF